MRYEIFLAFILCVCRTSLVLAFGSTPYFRSNLRQDQRSGVISNAAHGTVGGVDEGPKKAFVTGSTDGIGLHTATKLAEAGFDVFIHGR
jgi:hypothetical protein